MNLWDAIGALGQAVSALALIIVIVQVRHARSEVRRSISQTRSVGGRELLMSRANSAELCSLIAKVGTAVRHSSSSGPNDFVGELMATAGLTQAEALRLMFDQEAWWQYRAQTIQYIDELSEGERVGFDESIRQGYGGARFIEARWYVNRKLTLNPDAVRYVDNLLAKPG
jgi:hypothetical protein